MNEKKYIKELPDRTPVTLSVEAVFKRDDFDNFRIECRVCSGENTGDTINLYFYRQKKAGGLRKDTSDLLETLVPDGGSASDIPSWKLQGKIFETSPWKPETSKYQMYGRFKLIGNNDVF